MLMQQLEALMAVNMKIMALQFVTACSLLSGYQKFRRTCCRHLVVPSNKVLGVTSFDWHGM